MTPCAALEALDMLEPLFFFLQLELFFIGATICKMSLWGYGPRYPQDKTWAAPSEVAWPTRSSMAVPANMLTRAYFHLYKLSSPPSVSKDLGKSTSEPRSRD